MEEIKLKPTRDVSIDNYRGFVIYAVMVWCCMFLFTPHDFLVNNMWANHFRHGVGFGVMDYGMIMFMMASALSLCIVFNKQREQFGIKVARANALKRGLMLMGVGVFNLICLDIGNNGSYGWEVFMTIGIATMTTAFFVNFKPIVRFACGYGIIIVYALLWFFVPFIRRFSIEAQGFVYGGPFGGIACGGMMLVFSAVGEWLKKDYKKAIIAIVGIVAAATPSIVFTILAYGNGNVAINEGIAFILSISEGTCSPGFILFGTLVGIVTYLPFYIASKFIDKQIPLLADMGKNTIVFFFTFAIVQIIIPPLVWKLVNNSVALGLPIIFVVVTGVCILLNMLYKRFNIKVRL